MFNEHSDDVIGGKGAKAFTIAEEFDDAVLFISQHSAIVTAHLLMR